MKKLNQHLLLAAAMMLMAGSAYAQGPTNQVKPNGPATPRTPTNSNSANPVVDGASAGSYNPSYASYSQDSYISQTGSNNVGTVDQRDGRSSTNGGGSSAVMEQTGNRNTATQTQSLSNIFFSNATGTGSRNYVKTTQAGSNSQSDQTQNSGGYNTAIVLQGAGTTGNRAIQTQSVDPGNGYSDSNSALIRQTKSQAATSGSGNRAEQAQSGYYHIAQIDQESANSYAKQTQSGYSQSASIHQGDPGSNNTAMQTQTGSLNTALIEQSVGSTGSNNYALQNQSGYSNDASITQRSSNNYAEQQQSNNNNYSSMTQSNVASAAYSNQSGNANTAIVTQH
jgi:hypothetical protein